jgi:hypothetical protein
MKVCAYVVGVNCGKKGTATEYLRAGGRSEEDGWWCGSNEWKIGLELKAGCVTDCLSLLSILQPKSSTGSPGGLKLSDVFVIFKI